LRIQFHPYFHVAEATHVLSGLVWKYDEVKDVDPAWTIRVRVDGQPVNVQVVEDLLSSEQYREYNADSESPHQDGAEQVEIPSVPADN
jgi:hypothetical protein